MLVQICESGLSDPPITNNKRPLQHRQVAQRTVLDEVSRVESLVSIALRTYTNTDNVLGGSDEKVQKMVSYVLRGC